MSATLTETRPDQPAQARLGIVDCDVQPYTK
jgi:hypothetical protein